MKKYFLILIILPLYSNLFAQPMPVSVVTDSVGTITFYIEQLNNMAQQITNTLAMLEHQAKVVESLSQGDFDGFVDAFAYETRALGDFMHLAKELDSWDDFEELQNIIDTADFETLMEQTGELHDAMGKATEFMYRTQDLVHNTEYRLQTQGSIENLSEITDSVSGQLQLNQQSMALVQGELRDVVLCLTALNTFIATQEKNKQLDEKLKNKQALKFFTTIDEYQEPEVNDKLLNAIYGEF